MLKLLAIQAALEGDFKQAVLLNKKILKTKRGDLGALSRLAYAQAKLGQYEQAVKTYRRLLRLDPYNPIARKNLAKFRDLKNQSTKSVLKESAGESVSPSLFLARGEKTKSVELINVASKDVLQKLSIGEEVITSKRRFDLQVKSKKKVYLGTFPDDVGRFLINLMQKGGVCCRFFLQDIKENSLTVFVKWSALKN